MKHLHLFYAVTLFVIFGITDLSSQELHTHSNAASINNEADSTAGWGGSATESTTSTDAFAGTYSIKFEAPSNGWYYSGYSFNSTQDEQYTIQIYAKSDSPEDPGIYWSGVVENQSTPITSNNWTLYTKTVTATGGTININIYPGTPATSGNTVYIDNVSIVPLGSMDTQAPTAPTLSSTAHSQTTVDLSWSGATDDTAVTQYKVYKDGVEEAALGNVSSYQVTGLTADTSYNFTVTALDAADNESVASNSVSVTTDLAGDTQSPTAPTLSSTGHTETTVDLSWSGATDNVGVTGYNLYQDGTAIANNITATTYQVTGLTASTSYDFKIRALDAASNESVDSNIVTVTTNTASGGSSVWSESGSTASYTGEVAIGTSSVPSGYKLAVDGHIRTREIRVDQDTWPDYVFKEDYDLPSLEEIQEHIEKNGHLPNIPSAKEVEANGMDVGEMNKLLLEKIEEHTLYILEQQKEIVELKTQNAEFKKLLNTLLNQQDKVSKLTKEQN
nr:fibronectin type III domain-containing protein [Allomuricauda sp.]